MWDSTSGNLAVPAHAVSAALAAQRTTPPGLRGAVAGAGIGRYGTPSVPTSGATTPLGGVSRTVSTSGVAVDAPAEGIAAGAHEEVHVSSRRSNKVSPAMSPASSRPSSRPGSAFFNRETLRPTSPGSVAPVPATQAGGGSYSLSGTSLPPAATPAVGSTSQSGAGGASLVAQRSRLSGNTTPTTSQAQTPAVEEGEDMEAYVKGILSGQQ
jgi:hypothetical protein